MSAEEKSGAWIYWSVCFALPFLFALGIALAMRPEPASFLVPGLGPFAGIAYGHMDCTMAKAMPEVSNALVVLGPAWLVCLAIFRRGVPRAATLALGVLWTLGWEITALMSVLNASS